ncbi:hypothetical protein SESBI_47835 [Sesbania bispinosa]|nr:hypothetical protein SESBI_47835 [Sesbania bispinosa]
MGRRGSALTRLDMLVMSGDDNSVVLCGGTEQCSSNERLNVSDDGVAGETNGSTGEVSGELFVASSERFSMASSIAGGGKHAHNLPYSSDINQSLDDLKIKQDKNVAPMSTCQAASERGARDIDVRASFAKWRIRKKTC